jgi:hypothetical protein
VRRMISKGLNVGDGCVYIPEPSVVADPDKLTGCQLVDITNTGVSKNHVCCRVCLPVQENLTTAAPSTQRWHNSPHGNNRIYVLHRRGPVVLYIIGRRVKIPATNTTAAVDLANNHWSMLREHLDSGAKVNIRFCYMILRLYDPN